MNLRRMNIRIIICAIALIIISSTMAHATLIRSTVGLASPDVSIGFNEFGATGERITTQFSSLGVTFSPELYKNPPTEASMGPNINGDKLANFYLNPRSTINPFTINFLQNVTSASFAMQAAYGTYTFVATLDGVFVEQFNDTYLNQAMSGIYWNYDNFFGFKDILFNAITVHISSAYGLPDYPPYMFLDNLRYITYKEPVVTPEPSTYLLLGSGLAGLAYIRRRFKK